MSATLIISPYYKQLSYISCGMYHFLVKNKNIIIKLKANKLPFKININAQEFIIIYSYSITEYNNSDLAGYELALIDVAIKNVKVKT